MLTTESGWISAELVGDAKHTKPLCLGGLRDAIVDHMQKQKTLHQTFIQLSFYAHSIVAASHNSHSSHASQSKGLISLVT